MQTSGTSGALCVCVAVCSFCLCLNIRLRVFQWLCLFQLTIMICIFDPGGVRSEGGVVGGEGGE